MNHKRIVILSGAFLMLAMLISMPVLAAEYKKAPGARVGHVVAGQQARNHIQKNKRPVISGVIKSIGDTGFVIELKKFGTSTAQLVTVNTTASTTYGANGKATTSNALVVGQLARVKGSLDTTTKTITATKVIVGRDAKFMKRGKHLGQHAWGRNHATNNLK